MGKVIVLDLMETIMSGGGIYPVVKRQGLDEFLARHSHCRFVIATDLGSIVTKEESIKEVELYLKKIGIRDRISKIYYGWDIYNGMKDLKRIAEESGACLDDLVFIGDGTRDEETANFFGVRFIKVPAIYKEIIKTRHPSYPETYAEDYAAAPDKFSFENLEI